jgi:hypothetical protein
VLGRITANASAISSSILPRLNTLFIRSSFPHGPHGVFPHDCLRPFRRL